MIRITQGSEGTNADVPECPLCHAYGGGAHGFPCPNGRLPVPLWVPGYRAASIGLVSAQRHARRRPGGAWRHGASGYRNYGCRCKVCTEDHRLRHLREQRDRYARAAAGFSDFEHGRYGYNNWGCRCDRCSTDHRKRMREDAAARRDRKEQAVA
jgi:hypothetical protein